MCDEADPEKSYEEAVGGEGYAIPKNALLDGAYR